MDANQFKEKFLPYHRTLFRIAFRLMGNTQDAEDMVQEAYLKLWKKREELPDNINNREGYCITLLKNICYDKLRHASIEEAEQPPEEPNIPAHENLTQEVEQKEEVNLILKLIEKLPRQQQQIVLMRDVDNRPYSEIEQKTGLTGTNLRTLLSRARKKIREQFQEIMNYERL